MAVLVIAGSGRNAGKTAVGCALIEAMPGLRWTAVKVTSHAHGFHATGIQPAAQAEKDSARYLAAGAHRSFLIERVDGGEDLPGLIAREFASSREHPDSMEGLCLESNRLSVESVATADEAGLSLAVLAGPIGGWKSSVMERAATADALVLTGGFCCDELPPNLRRKRTFQMIPGRFSSGELIAFARRRLGISAK